MRREARSNLASSVVCADLYCRQASEEEEDAAPSDASELSNYLGLGAS